MDVGEDAQIDSGASDLRCTFAAQVSAPRVSGLSPLASLLRPESEAPKRKARKAANEGVQCKGQGEDRVSTCKF